MGRPLIGAVLVALVLASAGWAPAVEAAGAGARPATRSERATIIAAYSAADGNASEVRGVFVSRSDPSLAVVCARTPEAGTRSYVFAQSRHRWRYVTSGPVGKAGDSTERTLERACG